MTNTTILTIGITQDESAYIDAERIFLIAPNSGIAGNSIVYFLQPDGQIGTIQSIESSKVLYDRLLES